MGHFQSTWTDQAIEDLKKYIAEGLSASEIAAELRTTRNAVLGKVHRLRLNLRPRMGGPRPGTPRAPRQRSRPRPRIVGGIAYDEMPEINGPPLPGAGRPVTMMELGPNDCRAVLDAPAPVGGLYCGQTKTNDHYGRRSSYCAAHHALFCVPPSAKHTKHARVYWPWNS